MAITSSLVLSLVSAIAGTRWVSEGEVGVITSFGKAHRNKQGEVKLVESGFRIIIPVIQKINKVHIRTNNDVYTDQKVTLKNGLTYTYNCYVTYHVRKEPKAIETVLFLIEDYKEWISMRLEQTIQNVFQSLSVMDISKANESIYRILEAELGIVGIDLEGCGLTSFAATEATQAFLNIQNKINLAKQNYDVDGSILATAIGATPVVNVSNVKNTKSLFNDLKEEE